ncbi:MAG: cobalamin biosynthesis protein CobW [Mycobacteriaceae bacterium]|nr:cobalamin biosynthesis protein CobW [Mycobacteriaceae bacterium]
MDSRTPLVVVAGWSDPVRRVGASLLGPGTVLVRHDLSLVREGMVTRTVTTAADEQIAMVRLEHGCVSCTVRVDLLPLLRMLSGRASVERIVVLLDPAMDPAEICRAITHVPVTGMVGRADAPAGREVRITAVVGALDAQTWLADATGDETLCERLGTGGDDDRTVAQVALAQADAADAVVLFGRPDPLDAAVTAAVLARLAPGAPIIWADTAPIDVAAALAALPGAARAAGEFDPHAPLLRGSPPLDVDSGVVLLEFDADRPFHPERLHEAIDVLMDGVVTARGRVWLATQPHQVMWIESAGAALRLGPAGDWLAAMTPDEQAEDPERLAMAAARWHPDFGDRHTALVVLAHSADPSAIDRALRWALLTDTEMRRPQSWPTMPDPFGEWHRDPCDTTESTPTNIVGEGDLPL